MSHDAMHARGMIHAAIARCGLTAWSAAGRPKIVDDDTLREWPDIDGVGIAAIDAALPHLRPLAVWPEDMMPMRDTPNRWQIAARLNFLSGLEYLLRERTDALEQSVRREEPTRKAVRLIREAAQLMDKVDNPLLATLLYSIAEHAKKARHGMVFPGNTYSGYIIPDWVPEMVSNQELADAGTRQGVLLAAIYQPDALTGALAGKRGGKSRDANIIKAIATYFPESQDFLGHKNGYAVIAQLAMLCGLTGKTAQKNPNEYVRAVLMKGHT